MRKNTPAWFVPGCFASAGRPAEKKKAGAEAPAVQSHENRCVLHAAGGLGQASHLTCSLAGAGGEQFVYLLQLEAGVLGKDTHHGCDAVLLVVVLQEVENLLMVFGDFCDA